MKGNKTFINKFVLSCLDLLCYRGHKYGIIARCPAFNYAGRAEIVIRIHLQLGSTRGSAVNKMAAPLQKA
jgi:hypothetical protein